MEEFDIQLRDQYWITGSRHPDGDPEDLTSHGKIALIVQGQDISGCEDLHTDYGLNQSAIRLLQTVFLDHSPSDEHENPIFYHGCSIICTCPNCIIDYRVRRLNSEAILDQFFVSGGAEAESYDRFRNKVVQIDNLKYAETIVRFSDEVLGFLPARKSAIEELCWELEVYYRLRSELVRLINICREYLKAGLVTEEMRLQARELVVSDPF